MTGSPRGSLRLHHGQAPGRDGVAEDRPALSPGAASGAALCLGLTHPLRQHVCLFPRDALQRNST